MTSQTIGHLCFQLRALYMLPILALAVLAPTTSVRASLTATVVIDTPTELAIEWDWSEFDDMGNAIADLDMPILVNWDVTLSTTPTPPIPTWTVLISVLHTTAPHMGDAAPGNLVTLAKIFDDDEFLGEPVLPDVIAIVDHPAIGHFDAYQMGVFHSLDGTENKITLVGIHVVPGPPALLLLGVAGLMPKRRRRS